MFIVKSHRQAVLRGMVKEANGCFGTPLILWDTREEITPLQKPIWLTRGDG
jgi:hypothetical protein